MKKKCKQWLSTIACFVDIKESVVHHGLNFHFMVNDATNINKIVFVPVPSQYLDFQRFMSWSLLWSVILRSEVIVCFVDIEVIVDHHGLNFHVMVKNATNINKRVFLPVPSQYQDFQRFMSWSLLWSVILRSEVVACFVDIEGLADHHGLHLHFMVNNATNYQQMSVFACFKPVPGFQTFYVLVFIVFSDFKVRGDCLFFWYWRNCWPS